MPRSIAPRSPTPPWVWRADREWAEWSDGRTFGPHTPPLDAPDGLPEGREVAAQHVSGAAACRRTTGGWAVVRDYLAVGYRNFLCGEPTLVSLLRNVSATSAQDEILAEVTLQAG